jgi:integrase/recombinase XerD
VRVNSQAEVHTEGSYFIEWWVSGGRFREATTREDAIECARHSSVELRAILAGLIVSTEPSPAAEAKTPIGDAIDDYLK